MHTAGPSLRPRYRTKESENKSKGVIRGTQLLYMRGSWIKAVHKVVMATATQPGHIVFFVYPGFEIVLELSWKGPIFIQHTNTTTVFYSQMVREKWEGQASLGRGREEDAIKVQTMKVNKTTSLPVLPGRSKLLEIFLKCPYAPKEQLHNEKVTLCLKSAVRFRGCLISKHGLANHAPSRERLYPRYQDNTRLSY